MSLSNNFNQTKPSGVNRYALIINPELLKGLSRDDDLGKIDVSRENFLRLEAINNIVRDLHNDVTQWLKDNNAYEKDYEGYVIGGRPLLGPRYTPECVFIHCKPAVIDKLVDAFKDRLSFGELLLENAGPMTPAEPRICFGSPPPKPKQP